MARYKPRYQRNAAVKRRGRRFLLFASILILILSVPAITGTYAKYIQEDSYEKIAKAPEFYFTSDYLTAKGEEYVLNPDIDGTASVTFELRNYDGLNISELDINYNVNVSSSSGTYTLSSGSGTLPKKAQSKVAIQLSSLIPGERYVVTASGENGYQHTLKAVFTVATEPSGFFKNTRNYGDYVLLTVWTEKNDGTVSVNVPAGLIPDATDDVLTQVSEDSTFQVTLNAYESSSYRFFTTGDYNGGAISVTHNGSSLPETTLD